jgi:hypothetical protein
MNPSRLPEIRTMPASPGVASSVGELLLDLRERLGGNGVYLLAGAVDRDDRQTRRDLRGVEREREHDAADIDAGVTPTQAESAAQATCDGSTRTRTLAHRLIVKA